MILNVVFGGYTADVPLGQEPCLFSVADGLRQDIVTSRSCSQELLINSFVTTNGQEAMNLFSKMQKNSNMCHVWNWRNLGMPNSIQA